MHAASGSVQSASVVKLLQYLYSHELSAMTFQMQSASATLPQPTGATAAEHGSAADVGVLPSLWCKRATCARDHPHGKERDTRVSDRENGIRRMEGKEIAEDGKEHEADHEAADRTSVLHDERIALSLIMCLLSKATAWSSIKAGENRTLMLRLRTRGRCDGWVL